VAGTGQTLWWLQLLSLAVLAGLLQQQEGRAPRRPRRLVLRHCMADRHVLVAVHFMHVYGGLASPLAAAAVLLLAGFLSLYYALAAGLVRARAGSAWRDALLFARCGWARAAARHAVHRLSLGRRRLRPRGRPARGAGAVDRRVWHRRRGGLAGLAAALLARRSRGLAGATGSRWRHGGAARRLQRAHALAPPARRRPRLRVGLLQGNIPQDEKFEGGTGVPLALEWYGRSCATPRRSWSWRPRTAHPAAAAANCPRATSRFARRLRAGPPAPRLVGIPLGSFDEGYTNSVIGFRPGTDGAATATTSTIWCPFGEFIPPCSSGSRG
jgi:apolipoprotein N-acyltransferase